MNKGAEILNFPLPPEDDTSKCLNPGVGAFDFVAPKVWSELTTILSDRTDAVRLMGGYEIYPSLGENVIEWIAVVGEISNKLFWLGVDEASIKSCFDERHLMGTG